jgi:hydroxymethylbilane synthase
VSASRTLRIGTRASALALWQARQVAALIAAQPEAPAVELVHIKTSGDVQTEVPLWQVGGRAFFTREIDRALLHGTVDVAVHSLKDLSTQIEPGLTLAATLRRADPRDALVSASGAALRQLPPAVCIGTSSLRRRAFLARARPDAQLLELRGNVPTRLERLRRGDYDAIVLAVAGLARLNLEAHVSEYLPPDQFPPAVSQGVIGVCARSGDAATLRWLGPLDDHDARLATAAERALLRRLEGGCQVPLGALASVQDGTLTLHACVCALDGSRHLSVRGQMPASTGAGDALGVRLAEELLARGAGELMASERTARAVAEP